MIKLLACLLISNTAYANDGSAAVNSIIKAAYAQSGAQAEAATIGKELETRYISKEEAPYFGVFLFVVNSITHSEIRFKITF